MLYGSMGGYSQVVGSFMMDTGWDWLGIAGSIHVLSRAPGTDVRRVFRRVGGVRAVGTPAKCPGTGTRG